MTTNQSLPEWVDPALSARVEGLLTLGECQTVEFKAEFPEQLRDLGKEIAAFATSNSGAILIGVSDDGEVVGIGDNASDPAVRKTLLSRIEGLCASVVKPRVTPRIGFAWVRNRVVLFIEVPKGSRPLYFSNNIPYLRQLTMSRPAEPDEVTELVLASSQPASGDEGLQVLSSLYSVPADHIGVHGLVPGVAVSRYDESTGQPQEIHLVGTGHMILKLSPSMNSHHWTQTELRDFIAAAPDLLAPLHPTKLPLKWGRNDAGAAIWAEDASAPRVTRAATQLHQDGKIFGIDCVLLDAERLKVEFRTAAAFIPTGALEDAFETALPRYIKFASDHFKFTGHLTVHVGVCGIKGYRLGVERDFVGYFLQEAVYDSFSVDDPGKNYNEPLRGFFWKIWDAAGIKRPNDFRSTAT